ncbi:hypothetical protein ACIBG7_43055 [Nonomuraea sp. NPDC050328]|uniref:hypothetical protein n=1 Tax=Nonomuraea sp. NPDC050328 TaxID=3364361 RepID=UPI0037BE0DEF
MTPEQAAPLLAAATLVAALVFWAFRADGRTTARAAARRWHPSAKPLADLLEEPVALPERCGGAVYPERFPLLDEDDVLLAELVDRLWPDEGYLAVLDCPRPDLTAYRSPGESPAPEQAVDCVCGRVHIPARRPRRSLLRSRRRPGARRG